MHKEIERKFLVSDVNFLSDHDIRHTHFAQAYLAPEALRYEFKPDGENYEFRVFFNEEPLRTLLATWVPAGDYATLQEILYSRDGRPKVMPRVRILNNEAAVFTLKGQPQGLSRDEFEVPIALDAARAAFVRARSCLMKTRYFVAVGGKTFEIDVYEDNLKGLITAEVEFSEGEDPGKLELPDWVGHDVSEDITYSNAWLAEFGLEGLGTQKDRDGMPGRHDSSPADHSSTCGGPVNSRP